MDNNYHNCQMFPVAKKILGGNDYKTKGTFLIRSPAIQIGYKQRKQNQEKLILPITIYKKELGRVSIKTLSIEESQNRYTEINLIFQC